MIFKAQMLNMLHSEELQSHESCWIFTKNTDPACEELNGDWKTMATLITRANKVR
jgi:hypothetical protein